MGKKKAADRVQVSRKKKSEAGAAFLIISRWRRFFCRDTSPGGEISGITKQLPAIFLTAGSTAFHLLRGPISRVLSCVTIYLDGMSPCRSSHLSGAPDQ